MICCRCQAVNLDAPSEKGKRLFSGDYYVQSELQDSVSAARFCATKMKYSQHAKASLSFSSFFFFCTSFSFYYPRHLPTRSLFCVIVAGTLKIEVAGTDVRILKRRKGPIAGFHMDVYATIQVLLE